MSYEDWQSAIGPKVQGSWNLHLALGRRKILVDFFILFGSLSGLAGYTGQANYAAANTYLTSLAQYRQQRGLAASCIDIGAMEDIGYVSRNADVLSQFHKTSVHTLRERDLLDTLQMMLERQPASVTDSVPAPHHSKSFSGQHYFVSDSHVAIGLASTTPLSALNNRTTWKDDRRMAAFWNSEYMSRADALPQTDQLKEFLAEALLDPSSLETSSAAHLLATAIGKTLFGLLMLDVELLDLEQQLDGLGIDSLVSIELRNWFKRKLGVDITVLEILDSANLLVLGQRVALRLKEKVSKDPLLN